MKFQLYLQIIIMVVFSSIALPEIIQADESCGITSPDTEVGAPPLCRGRSVDALLSAETQEPDFGDVEDILQGVRTILPVDDLVVMNPTGRLPGQSSITTTIQDFFFFTDNDTITKFIEPDIIASANCDGNGPRELQGWPYGMPSPQQTNPVRMFNLDRDMVVTYSFNNRMQSSDCDGLANTTSITIQDPLGLIDFPEQEFTNVSIPFMHSVVADFDFDGYEDILILVGPGFGLNGVLYVYTAVDPDDPTKGVKSVLAGSFPTETNRNPMSSPVAGDFNGDSIIDVAWVGSSATDQAPYNIFFASVCPGSTPKIPLCNGKPAFELVQDPLSSQIIPLNTSVNANAQFAYPASALAVGDFNRNFGDELVVFYGLAGSKGGGFEHYTFDQNMSPTKLFSDVAVSKWYNIYASGGQLDISQAREQVVVAIQSDTNCPLNVYTFDDLGSMIQHRSDWVGPINGIGSCNGGFLIPSIYSLNGLAVGRFTNESPVVEQDLAPQIAIFYSQSMFDGGSYSINIYEAQPSNNFIAKGISQSTGSNANLGSYNGSNNPNRAGSLIKAGDLQGRSAVLGSPDIVRVPNWLQVNTIIGAPPMHTAYVRGINQPEPVVNNFTVSPPTFTTSFTTGTNTSTTDSHANKTSWSFSFEQSLEATKKWSAIPIIGGPKFQVNISGSANQTYDCNVEAVNSSYSTIENVITTPTGFGDNLIYTESRKNIYFYPVIGQTVCPDGTDDCLESEREPFYYQITAPDQICTNLVPGRTSEFYQPVHQPGNIFTYPASRNQLIDRFSSDQSSILSEPTLGFLTNNSPFNQIKKWDQGRGNECTTGTTENISFDESISFSFGAGILDKFDGPGTNVTSKFDFGQSKAISSNEVLTSMTSDSIGIEVEKPNEFLNPDEYQYLINSFIFGQPFPVGTWESLFDDQTSENINNSGPLIVAFTSNMLSNDSGSWWESGGINSYLQFPDIGLNFPARWRDVPVKTGSIATQPPDCRLEKFNADKLTCTLIKKAAETDGELWSSGFYHIRGFFLQAGDDPIGPSQSYVYFGDTLNLTTRVYNLSLKAMDSTDQVKVQFYRQEWDNTLNVPIGDSILISEETMSPIPPFTASDNPNWNLVSTSLNTADAEMGPGKYWVFWVLVYAVDQNGDLVEEIPGYGLKEGIIGGFKPGDIFKSILDVPLTEVTVKEIEVDAVRSFTNNVGFFKHAVYVASQPLGTIEEIEPTLFIDNIKVAPPAVLVGEEVLVTADIYSLDSAADGVMVHFFPSHPDESEMPFDTEMLSNIEQDGLHNVQVVFQPEFCGEHDLHIAAGNNGACNLTSDLQSIKLNVICEPGDTNLDGQLIGNNGQPVSMNNNNCSSSLAGASDTNDVIAGFLPFIILLGIILMRRTLWAT